MCNCVYVSLGWARHQNNCDRRARCKYTLRNCKCVMRDVCVCVSKTPTGTKRCKLGGRKKNFVKKQKNKKENEITKSTYRFITFKFTLCTIRFNALHFVGKQTGRKLLLSTKKRKRHGEVFKTRQGRRVMPCFLLCLRGWTFKNCIKTQLNPSYQIFEPISMSWQVLAVWRPSHAACLLRLYPSSMFCM